MSQVYIFAAYNPGAAEEQYRVVSRSPSDVKVIVLFACFALLLWFITAVRKRK